MEIHHAPKPVHSWREFLKEYAIIVLGVLTALAGEELVATIHHRYEVADLRRALHLELASDLRTMRDTAADLPCVEQRLKELEAWKTSLQSPGGQPAKITVPTPSYMIFRTSTWRSATGEVMDNLPLDERIAYAQFYDGVDNNSAIRNGVQAAWRDLAAFEDAHVLGTAELRQVTRDMDTIRDGYRRIASNYADNFLTLYVPATNVRIEEAPLSGAQGDLIEAKRATLCKPITAT